METTQPQSQPRNRVRKPHRVTAENLHVPPPQVELFPKPRDQLAEEAKQRRPIRYPLRKGATVRLRADGCVRRITRRYPDVEGREYRYEFEGFEKSMLASEVEVVG